MPTWGSESASLRVKVLVYLHAKHETEKFKDTCSLWEKWFHLQPAAGKWGSYTHVLTHCHPQAMRKIPNCSSKSHSQGRTSAAKLFLAGSMGVGEGSGLPPHAVRLPARGRHQVRALSEVTEPLSATSSEPAQGAENEMQAAYLWRWLNTPQVSRTNQKLLQPPHPKRSCLFLSNSKLLQQYRLIANNIKKKEKKFHTEGRLMGAHKELWQ